MKNLQILLYFLIFGNVYGQNITDIVRWSDLDPAGTARTLGVGSAFGAMGGDFSVININPAGIADFRISEFTFTPSLNFSRTEAYFAADKNSLERSKRSGLGLDNIGFVISTNRKGSSWTSSNLAIGFSRIADFNRNIFVQGQSKGSITTMFAEKANTISEDDLDDFIAFPALSTGAIYDFDKDLFYDTDFTAYPEAVIQKEQELIQRGGINELAIGWAGEYQNKLNIGISMGIPFANFEETKVYQETDPNNNVPAFNRLSYTERLNTTGLGVNFKLGFIYKMNNTFRLGGAIHSPTWFRFTDDYTTSLTYSYIDNGVETYTYNSPDGNFRYRMSNPWRAVGSVGTIYRVGEIKGFLNADIEFVDYTSANYNGTAYSNDPSEAIYTNEVNRSVQNKLASATNLRLGTELAYQSLRLRVGYSWEQSPFNADNFYNNRLSFGIGIREDRFFVDLGIRISERAEGYNPYVVLDQVNLDPLTNINTNRTKGAITVGFKF
ncbi:MAG: hypothetical protein IPM42_09355 [Saprospiraceae bacterium]|nr:hypothetical protein [Saprospiraceae bacterium]